MQYLYELNSTQYDSLTSSTIYTWTYKIITPDNTGIENTFQGTEAELQAYLHSLGG